MTSPPDSQRSQPGDPSGSGVSELAREVGRRRTFAIISHPDAGKTTLTEKLLLFGGALREAGAVRARRAARHATSDWLELEKQRGISVSSSVMHFEHAGCRVSILDTPGHRDFSEDTYRTLVAADSAVMLIDAAKGVEAQTRKLFEVCRMRKIPIFTFVNKMDRFGRDPLELMSEIEEVLGIDVVPVNWPIGSGAEFRGVFDRIAQQVQLFSGGNHGTSLVDQRDIAGGIHDATVREAMGPYAGEVADSLELLDGAGAELQDDLVREGSQTPMFFGSALTNFGVLPFLDHYLRMAPCPGSRVSDTGLIDPVGHSFSGFVFKIQANMDPDHRDRIAFFRVCSGKFVKGISAEHVRTGKRLRLSNSSLLMGKDRADVEEAYPGDVVGLFDPGIFRIGDTLAEEGSFNYPGIPSFSPERFARVEVARVMKRKALEKGLDQLAQEGAVQLFSQPGAGSAGLILGGMGTLQFDVMIHRMSGEYGVKLELTPLPFELARWVQGDFDASIFRFAERIIVVEDREGRPVLLARNAFDIDRALDKNPELELSDVADPTSSTDRLAASSIRYWKLTSSRTIGAGEASDEWLAAFGAYSLDGTLVGFGNSQLVGLGAALYFVCSLSRPNRSSPVTRDRG